MLLSSRVGFQKCFVAAAASVVRCRFVRPMATVSNDDDDDGGLLNAYHCKETGDRVEIWIPDTPNACASTPTTTTTTTNITTIPETVLQYERQLRKRRAADRAGGPVTKEQHLKVLFQDDHLVVVNKPSGVLCVPGINQNPSLATVVYQEYIANNNNNTTIESLDGMVVHRLDMDTSGVVVFGRSREAVVKLHRLFREKRVTKTYQALVCGHVQHRQGSIRLPLQRDHRQPPFMRVATPHSERLATQAVADLQTHGFQKLVRKQPKPSQTDFCVVRHEHLDNNNHQLPVTRLALTPVTGRTHQLRVHCAALGHAIVADPAYGIYGEASANGGFPPDVMNRIAPHRASLPLQQAIHQHLLQCSSSSSKNDDDDGRHHQYPPMCLHAQTLSLQHPITQEPMQWEAPVPF